MNYSVLQLDEVAAKRCPCGFTRRGFADVDGTMASLHLVDIAEDSQTHYHKRTTEIYLVLEGTGRWSWTGSGFRLSQ